MTRMVVSVNTPDEAQIALSGGADVIDFTATTPEVIRAGAATVAGRSLLSAGIADQATDAVVREIAATGVDTISVAIVPDVDRPLLLRALVGVAAPAKLVGVVSSLHLAQLPMLADSGFAGAMIDTGASSLLDRIDIAHLPGFIGSCHAVGLLAGLAGALEPPDIPRLLVLAPDFLSFDFRVGPGLAGVMAVRGLIPREGAVPDVREVDYLLLATEGCVPNAAEQVPIDLVFVEDLVLPVFIGAYSRERDAPQNVRFAVAASVLPSGRTAKDMRDVFSYDLITDGIRILTGSGHVTFVETLAERIAAMVLRHPRVTKVVVRVQKLETGSGSVGVEIERTRSAIGAKDRPSDPRKANIIVANKPSDTG